MEVQWRAEDELQECQKSASRFEMMMIMTVMNYEIRSGVCLGIKVELIFEGRIYHQPTQYCHEIENLDVKARANQVCESVGGRMKGKRGCVKAYRRVRICFEMYRM